MAEVALPAVESETPPQNGGLHKKHVVAMIVALMGTSALTGRWATDSTTKIAAPMSSHMMYT